MFPFYTVVFLRGADMKRTVLAALLVPAAALAAPKRPSQRYSIEQFMATTRISGASFSADEKRILFSSNESGVFNAYSVPVTGGKAVALTSSKDTTYAVSYFPNDDRILYTRDSGGDEQNHLYLRDLDGSEKDLTPGKLKARFFSWARDLSAFYVETNERDPKFFDFYRYDAKDARAQAPLPESGRLRHCRRHRRRKVDRARENADHDRQRHLPRQRGHEGAQAHHAPQGRGIEPGGRFRSCERCALLPHRR